MVFIYCSFRKVGYLLGDRPAPVLTRPGSPIPSIASTPRP
jgi:hypothetical protein